MTDEAQTPAPRVLVVDDEEAVRGFYARFLPRHGIEAECHAGPTEALEAFGEGFDAVVTDLLMKSMDGLRFAQGIRRRDPRIPILMVTGFASESVRRALSGLGVDLLVKPVDGTRLIGWIRSSVRAARSREPDAPSG